MSVCALGITLPRLHDSAFPHRPSQFSRNEKHRKTDVSSHADRDFRLNQQRETRMNFNMGCGHNHWPGYVNVDAFKECAPDQVVDLEQTPWPWPDNCANEVVFIHSLEHMGADTKVFLAIMQELYRICKHGAHVIIRVPHPRHDHFINDPSHVRIITVELMELFSKKKNDQWKQAGFSNSPFAHYLGVDFEIVKSRVTMDEPYFTKFKEKKISVAEIEYAIRYQNNVLSQIDIELQVVKE
jgi:hypothetical protein